MINEEIKILTSDRPIEAFVMHKQPKPDKAFLILPGRGYTVNHFLLDFLWRMAAEKGFYSIKAEYRGYTYRHFNEPYDHEHATADAWQVIKHLEGLGYSSDKVIACGKSLGSIAVGNLVMVKNVIFDKVVLLTPVLYVRKEDGVFPSWQGFLDKIPDTQLVFGSNDEYCDLESAHTTFPQAIVSFYQNADHGLHVNDDYSTTIEINRDIIEKVKDFIVTS